MAAARDAAALDGEWPLSGFDRLVETEGPERGAVRWSIEAGWQARPGEAALPMLRLVASATVHRECQRCLQPMALPLAIDRRFLFAADEASAEALDADNDEIDVLALTSKLDLHALTEDELLLALPLVPRHDSCPQPLPREPGPTDVAAATAPHPFAALAALKRRH